MTQERQYSLEEFIVGLVNYFVKKASEFIRFRGLNSRSNL